MINFNFNLTLDSDSSIEDLCDEINEAGKGDVRAEWTENDNGTISVKVAGSTDSDEYTYCTRIDRIIDRIRDLYRYKI